MKAISVRSACGVTAIVISMIGASCSSEADPLPAAGTGTGGQAGATVAGQTGGAGKAGAAGNPTTAGGGAAGQASAGQSGGAAGGGAGTGTAGASGSAGGTAGGTAAGTGGGSSADGCPTTTKTPAELHAAAAAVLLPTTDRPNGSCSGMSCHGSRKTAGVDLQSATGDLRALLNINACEVPAYKIVDATGGEAALTKSWLWQKLTAPADGSTELVPQAAWGTAANCGQMAGGFGSRMPWQSTTPLAQDKLDAVKAWICAGAPGK